MTWLGELELPLAREVLDRTSHLRADSAWLEAAWTDPASRVAEWHRGALRITAESRPRILWRPPRSGEPRDEGDWVFLGLDEDHRAHFLLAVPEEPEGPTADVRTLGVLPDADLQLDLSTVIGGVGVLNWHGSHRHCPRCGEGTQLCDAGWRRHCSADDSDHFPRVDPAVIMAVVDEADRLLLGRQVRWPAGWFSTLAGFVEPGEAFASAVTREVAEETGIVVTAVDYVDAQPWPFPSSLMIGFRARARADQEPQPDGEEMAEARWFTRARLRAECEQGTVRLPPALSISRALIEQWFGAALPGEWSRR